MTRPIVTLRIGTTFLEITSTQELELHCGVYPNLEAVKVISKNLTHTVPMEIADKLKISVEGIEQVSLVKAAQYKAALGMLMKACNIDAEPQAFMEWILRKNSVSEANANA